MTNPEVSIVPTQADRELRDQIIDVDWPGNHAAYEDELDQIIACHRLAHQTPPATQPIAEVGEVEAILQRYSVIGLATHEKIAGEIAALWSHSKEDAEALERLQQIADKPDRWRAIYNLAVTPDPMRSIAFDLRSLLATLRTPPPVATATVVDDEAIERSARALRAGWPNSLANVTRGDLLSMVRTVAKHLAATPTPPAGGQ